MKKMNSQFTEDERKRIIKIGKQLGHLSEEDVDYMSNQLHGERQCQRRLTDARYRKINEGIKASMVWYDKKFK